jgi:hypothetical protein
MKQNFYPHLLIDDAWGTNIVFFNTSNQVQVVHVSIQPQGGEQIRSFNILPKQRFILDEKFLALMLMNDKRPFALALLLPDAVVEMVGLYTKNPDESIKFFQEILPSTPEEPESFYGPRPDGSMAIMAFNYLGYPNTNYLQNPHAYIVDYYARTYDIQLGDCCIVDFSDPEGHPPGTHSSGRSFDINYPLTIAGTTHYPVISATLFDADGALIPERFDYRRFMDFIYSVKATTVFVDQRIESFLASKYGANSVIQGTPVGQYNHDKHAHVNV